MAGVVPLVAGVVCALCGLATLGDYRRFGTRMVEGAPRWLRVGTVAQHRRVLGGAYLGFGLLLVLLGIADLVVA